MSFPQDSTDLLLKALLKKIAPSKENDAVLWSKCRNMLNTKCSFDDGDTHSAVKRLSKHVQNTGALTDSKKLLTLICKLKANSLDQNFPALIQFLIEITDRSRSSSLSNGQSTTTSIKSEKRSFFKNTIKRDPQEITLPPKATNFAMQANSESKAARVESQKVILREVIYALQGIDGKMFTISDRVELKQGAMDIPRCMKMQIMRFLELGWLYKRLHSLTVAADKSGQCFKGFITYVRQELEEYRLLISLIDQLAKDDSSFGLNGLHVWLWEPLYRLKGLAVLSANCEGQKGGSLLSLIYEFSLHGAQLFSDLGARALSLACAPLFIILVDWITTGNLQDFDNEFFITELKECDKKATWTLKYSLRHDYIPSFISEAQARKILLIGKALNFLRILCEEKDFEQEQDFQIPDAHSMYRQDADDQFDKFINERYKKVGSHMIHVLFTRYHLLEHFAAIRNYLFLAKGDFVRHLVDSVYVYLNEPAESLRVHRLRPSLDSALRSTNSQYEIKDVLSRIDIKLLTATAGELGWDVFSLYYTVDGPLLTVFQPDIMTKYLRIFNFLWRVKRLEFATCALWKSLLSVWKLAAIRADFKTTLQECHLLCQVIVHFISQLNGYIMFEVLECSWQDFCLELSKAEDLDKVIKSNEVWVHAILDQLSLSHVDSNSEDFLRQVYGTFSIILQFKQSAEKFIELVTSHQKRRNVSVGLLVVLQKEMRDIKAKFEERISNILKLALDHKCGTLKFLNSRLDFNSFYSNSLR